MALTTATPDGMQKLLNVVSDFCSWSGMRLKLQKSVITAFDYGRRMSLPTDQIRYNGAALVHLPAGSGFKYLGINTALTKRRKRANASGPCTAAEVEHVLSTTRELTRLLADHQLPLSIIVPSMRMVAASRFRYSAALVPWSDAALDKLSQIWMQVERAAWKLQLPVRPVSLTTGRGGSAARGPG